MRKTKKRGERKQKTQKRRKMRKEEEEEEKKKKQKKQVDSRVAGAGDLQRWEGIVEDHCAHAVRQVQVEKACQIATIERSLRRANTFMDISCRNVLVKVRTVDRNSDVVSTC